MAATIDSFAPLIARHLDGAWALEERPPWVAVRHRDAVVPDQGWKLHVAAGLPGAHETLERVLPVLLAEPLAFKVAGSFGALAALNDGNGALSQVGKFVTVYPVDDAQAVRVAERLAAVTRGLSSPSIPSDRRLAPGAVVHYRFGSFGGRTVQGLTGEVSHALVAPDGRLEPDLRNAGYRVPTWAVDPFEAAGVASPLPDRTVLVGERFLLIGALHRSPRGGVHLALDVDTGRQCVLKHAEAGPPLVPGGPDGRGMLRREAEVLARLAPDPRVPAVLALVEHDDDLYLALEDLGGTTLERHVMAHAVDGRTLPHEQVVAWGIELAEAVAGVHDQGLVHRDLKSVNVLVGDDGALRLIDFEHACAPGTPGLMHGRGTRGYASPQQAAGADTAVTDDIHALGALLAYLATGAEPSQAPDPHDLLARPLEVLRPSIDPRLAALVARCLDPDPAARPQTARELAAALSALRGAPPVVVRAPAPLAAGAEAAARRRCHDLGRRLGDTLCAVAVPDGDALTWVSTHPLGQRLRCRDVNTGAAGALLALAELVEVHGDAVHADTLARGARWLAGAPGMGGERLPGLYVGEAGVGAALLRAGRTLGDAELVAAARERGRRVAALAYRSPDLFNGSAGRLRFHLLLWDATGDPAALTAAVAAGDHVLATMEDAGDGAARWAIPEGYGGLTGTRHLGYGHGVAGIGDALLDLFEATGDERYADGARGAARLLERTAHPALDDGSGLNWPAEEGGEPAAAYWCHGAAGIGRFWLHVAALDLVPGAADIAARAVATAAYGSRWTSPTPCHGLAGTAELLVDAYQATGDAARLAEARVIGRLLEAFATETGAGLAWTSESPATVSPDHHVGYAGVASALLRLAAPETRGHVLSREGFRGVD